MAGPGDASFRLFRAAPVSHHASLMAVSAPVFDAIDCPSGPTHVGRATGLSPESQKADSFSFRVIVVPAYLCLLPSDHVLGNHWGRPEKQGKQDWWVGSIQVSRYQRGWGAAVWPRTFSRPRASLRGFEP